MRSPRRPSLCPGQPRRRRLGSASLAVAVAALIGAAPAAAEVHVTSAANAGAGSLRAAVEGAPLGETVVIDPGVNPVLSGEIALDKSLTIRGQGAAATRIGVTGQTRVFKVGGSIPGIRVAIEALEIAGGQLPTGNPGGSAPAGPGQPGEGGGAILNKANQLRLVGVRLSGNRAGGGGPGGLGASEPGGAGGAGGSGGAIWNSGGLAIVDSTLAGNRAGLGGIPGPSSFSTFPSSPGPGGSGGAIFNSGVMTIVDSTLAENEAGAGATGGGGGTSSFGGGGSSGGSGGAIANIGTLTISGSTFAGDRAGTGGAGGVGMVSSLGGGFGGAGGAIFAEGATDLTNSTFIGNLAGTGGPGTASQATVGPGGPGGSGGAVAATAATRIAATTVTVNGAGLGGAGTGGGLAGASGSGGGVSGAATVRASIVAANDGANCNGPVVDGGANLAFPEAGGCPGFAVLDPKLDPGGLAANGGPTETIALSPGSAALGLVPAAACLTAAGEPLTVDQRGVARPAGACDAGAYEAERPPPSPPTPPGAPEPPHRVVPETRLAKKPQGRIVTRRKRARIVVAFGSDQAGASFECRLDKGRFAPCESPRAYRLRPGRHTIAVRSVLAGVVDPTPAQTSFKVVEKPKKKPRAKRHG